METSQIYQSIKKRGGSGRGMSYWQVPAMCGRKRRLMDEHPDVETLGDQTALTTGVYYHYLKEIWLNGQMPEGQVIDNDPVQDMEWGEAVRLFNWHREQFPRDYWGQIVAVELGMPVNESHAHKIKEWIGHDEATGTCDLVVKMSAMDVARVMHDRDIELPGPGIYIVDHKTAGARKSEMDGKATYAQSMQCLTYMAMLQLAFNEPVKGMIFDVLIKHKQLRRHDEGRNGSSVQTFVGKPSEEHHRIVRGAIAHARTQREQNLANPFACYEYGRECVFLSRGQCGRY